MEQYFYVVKANNILLKNEKKRLTRRKKNNIKYCRLIKKTLGETLEKKRRSE